MSCYGVDTSPIESMSEVLESLPIDLTDAEPDRFGAYAKDNRESLSRLVAMYLDAVSCFLTIMRAVASRRLELEREFPLPKRIFRPRTVDRTYLRGFLPIYDRASDQAVRRLRQMLIELFAEDAELQAAFVAQMVASETVQEGLQFCRTVQTAKHPEEAQEHGLSGKQIQDSIKEFLLSFLKDIHVVRFVVKKRSIERGLHVLNEIVGMVYRGPND